MVRGVVLVGVQVGTWLGRVCRGEWWEGARGAGSGQSGRGHKGLRPSVSTGDPDTAEHRGRFLRSLRGGAPGAGSSGPRSDDAPRRRCTPETHVSRTMRVRIAEDARPHGTKAKRGSLRTAPGLGEVV